MRYYFIDLFCGAGGVTAGLHNAIVDEMNIAQVVACVNHDITAIESHAANHPDVLHYTEDIRTLDITDITKQVRVIRNMDADAVICLWASLECTNFSKAKGGMPRDGDSRTLAEHLFRYIEGIDPDMIWIENVEEFMSWGPLDENGKPLSRNNGRDFIRWTNAVQLYGYGFEYRILNAADYGAYTSRKRFFAQFAKPHIRIVWPQPTHSKKPYSDMFGGLQKWKAVRDVLNLETTGESIFVPGRIKSDKTFERIYQGLIKFVAGGKKEFESFLIKFNSTAKDGNVKHSSASLDNPSPTIDTQNRLRVVDPVFISAYYGNGHNCTGIDKPSPTVTTKDRLVFVSPHFIYRDFSNSGFAQGIDAPSGSMTLNPKLNLITAEQFLMDTQFGNNAKPLSEPSPTQTSSRKHYYLMNPQWFNTSNSSIDNPCFTIIARQDKTPAYIVCAESGGCAIEVFEDDLPHAILIKAFMAIYRIVDVKMRMLEIEELLRIQGFSDSYVLKGSKTKQKWMLGNAVEVNQAKVLVEASYSGNKLVKKVAVA